MSLARPPFVWMKDPHLLRLLDVLDGEARYVGGCVRDSLAKKYVSDVDMATPLPPQEVMARLEKADIKALPTGIVHGTVTAVLQRRKVEITTLRSDIECDGRHATVRFGTDWREDAARRDFTINALYLSPSAEIFDYHDGQADLDAGRLRFIGDAAQRIREDALRVLRFFRFHTRFSKGEADAAALEACASHAALLEGLSDERVHGEMHKLLETADGFVPTIRHMEQAGLFPHLGLAGASIPRLETLLVREAPFVHSGHGAWVGQGRFIRRLAALLACDGAVLAERWRLSNAEKKTLHLLQTIRLPAGDEVALKHLVRTQGRDIARDALLLSDTPAEILPALVMLAARWEIPVFPVTGDDLIARGMKPGTELGQRLAEIEAAWEASDYTLDKEALLTL